jgi:hypothetical protein
MSMLFLSLFVTIPPHCSLMVMMLLPYCWAVLTEDLGLAKLLLFYWMFNPKIAYMSRKDPIKISYQDKLRHEVKIGIELHSQA